MHFTIYRYFSLVEIAFGLIKRTLIIHHNHGEGGGGEGEGSGNVHGQFHSAFFL